MSKHTRYILVVTPSGRLELRPAEPPTSEIIREKELLTRHFKVNAGKNLHRLNPFYLGDRMN